MIESESNSQANPPKITELDFANYLRQNPDFFERHPSLLAQLVVPHPHSGQAVSLLERKVIVMREQQDDAQRKLRELVKNARDNEKLSEGMDQFSVHLAGVKDIDQLTRMLPNSFRDNFNPEFQAVILNADKALLAQLSDTERCTCSTKLSEPTLKKIFRADSSSIKSVASIPLRYANFGLVAFGSSDASRYSNHTGTRYLDQLQRLLTATLHRISG